MIAFFTELWEQIVLLWAEFVASIPGWIDTFLEAVKALGIGGIALIIAKYVIPILKKTNSPVLTKIELLQKQVDALEAKEIARSEKEAKIDSLFLEYMTLSCQVNSVSRTLSPENKLAYTTLAAKFGELGKETIADKIQDVVEAGKEIVENIKESPIVEKIMEVVPEKLTTTVENIRDALTQRG